MPILGSLEVGPLVQEGQGEMMRRGISEAPEGQQVGELEGMELEIAEEGAVEEIPQEMEGMEGIHL